MLLQTLLKRGEISVSHGGEYEDDCLQGCAPCSLVETD
jgi:hypothetical protein